MEALVGTAEAVPLPNSCPKAVRSQSLTQKLFPKACKQKTPAMSVDG
jgi:hypothetical protein